MIISGKEKCLKRWRRYGKNKQGGFMKEETVIPKMRTETRVVKIVFELKKDLQEDEVVCEHCHGTGLEISNNIYGIQGDVTHVGVRFPYKHQSINYCRFCYNGIQRKCPSCGSLRGKMNGECSCGCSERERQEQWKKEDNEKWERAEKVSIEQAWKDYDCLYIDDIDKYVFDDGELDDLIEDYELENPRIFVTTKTGIEICAADIIADACEYLHEDADEQCNTEELQVILDEWCKKQDGTTTYLPNRKIGVIRTQGTQIPDKEDSR
jgi:hypothetical protein